MKELEIFINSISPISQHTWEQVMPLFSAFELKKGHYFIEQGQMATKIGFLQSGIVRAFYRNDEGVEYNKHFFVPNSFVGGYASFITGKPNQIIQQALTNCHILVADYAKFSKLFDNHSDLERTARKLAEIFFVNKEGREIEIVLLDAETRYGIFQKQFPDLEQIIPQYHIASYLGITPTQLSRIRRKLTKR
ncbi:Crp/Fnr family transcriptional regulator [Emticicia sp. SJ17W-69]|uniref:Crp/Fnr family transcriptional regulator n=1 Tax=Emticicia sp. SJ17W-69 TaxID=3421657 RepID=UPI003EB82A45